MTAHEILFITLSYLLGSIRIDRILLYLIPKKDTTKKGSGDIDASNILSTRGKAAGIITLVLDMLKGMIPIIYGSSLFDSPLIIMAGGAAVILGHLFPLFFKFKGGKGIAAFVGVFIIFNFPAAVVFLAAFILTLALSRYVSAGSLVAVITTFFFILFTSIAEVSLMVFVLVILITVKHSSHIKRLIAGSENKVSWKKNG